MTSGFAEVASRFYVIGENESNFEIVSLKNTSNAKNRIYSDQIINYFLNVIDSKDLTANFVYFLLYVVKSCV